MGDKRITNTSKIILVLWNVGLFVAVWFMYYNKYAFNTHYVSAGLICCIIYVIIYMALCRLYQAFRIASTNVLETIFCQVLSFGIADLVLYIECCLISNRYIHISRGVITVLVQIVGTSFIVMIAKQCLMKYIVPKHTLLLYGSRVSEGDAKVFADRLLQKYNHLFRIDTVVFDRENTDIINQLIDEHEGVILFESSVEMRGDVMKKCTEKKKNLYYTPRIEDILCQGVVQKYLLDTPMMKYEYQYDSKGGYVGKRGVDIFFAIILLILLSPIMLITAIAIKLEDHGPVFFKQKRCTKDGRVFEIIKFRSMVVDAEKDGVKPCTANDSRMTRTGRFIRATRIDELPQLINILKNDMSFVGPRPERIEHVEAYMAEMPEFAYRFRVNGGLTGYAQIYGKYNTSAYDKLRLDLMYVEKQSFILDLKLIMLTIKILFKAESTEGFSNEKSEIMNLISSDGNTK